MHTDIKKYKLKRSSWWGSGNFKIFDQSGKLIYRVRSQVFEFRKRMRMLDEDDNVVLRIEARHTWPLSFTITESSGESTEVKFKAFSYLVEWHGKEIGTIKLKGNMWGKYFKIHLDGNELGIMSHKLWTSGEMGVAIDASLDSPGLLGVASCVAFLKESGQL